MSRTHYTRKPDREHVRMEAWNYPGNTSSAGVYIPLGPRDESVGIAENAYVYVSQANLSEGDYLTTRFSVDEQGDVSISLHTGAGMERLVYFPDGAWTRVWIHGYTGRMNLPDSFEIIPEDLS